MSTSSKRVADIISDIEGGRLEVRPFFQRRLVWTNSDKEQFIDTVLRGYPFPEIFVATGELDVEKITRTSWLVDGQQRVTTLREYVRGSGDLRCRKVPPFKDLSPADRTKVLDYEIAVRDLGTITSADLKEIFRRINSTDYALKSMEVLNAMFSGAFNEYCEGLSRNPFFEQHKVFSKAMRKRMYDVTFCVILVGTVLGGYYRRDERNEEFLERFNDDFPHKNEVDDGLAKVFDFVDKCNFSSSSRVWKTTDLFTVLVEFYTMLVSEGRPLVPAIIGAELSAFFDRVDAAYSGDSKAATDVVQRYLKAATKATNDKYARIERAEIISSLCSKAGKTSKRIAAKRT
jgi:hypothetical protein